MSVTLGLLLNEHNARSRRGLDPRVGLVLLERTLFDPPRAAAAKRWAPTVRRSFPNAQLLPFVWHLVSHGPEERMHERTTRTLSGPPHRFGGLQDSPQTRQAWDVTRLCAEAMESTTVVVRTPPSLTPGSLGRARIRAFVEQRRSEGIEVVWEPQGLWEADVAAALAAQLGIQVILPAFAAGRALRSDTGGLAAPGAWLRVDGVGPRRAIHGGHVDELLDHIDAASQPTVIVCTGPRARANLALLAEQIGT